MYGGFDVFKTYLAVKNHFTTDYDYNKYGGRVTAKLESFTKRPDRYFFHKLSKRYNERDILDYFVSKKTKESVYLTQIEKTVYSKGGGSGAGAYITKMSEMGVAVCLAAIIHSKGKCYNSSKKVLAPEISGVCDLGTGNTKNEIELIELINSFQNIMDKAINMVRPDIITNYLYKVAQTFHSYYAETKIIASSIKGEKVTLIKCIDKIIISGLKVLDIKPMDRM